MKCGIIIVTFTILKLYESATEEVPFKFKVQNPIFQTGLVCVKALSSLKMDDENYREIQVKPDDFHVEVKGYSLIEDNQQFRFPLGLAVVVHSPVEYDILIAIALSEHVQPMGKYFTKFIAKDKTCAPSGFSPARFNARCDARSSYFKNTRMFYLEKDVLQKSVDIYWSPTPHEGGRTNEFVQFFFIAVNTKSRTFYTNIESDLISKHPPEGEDKKTERRVQLKALSRSKRDILKPDSLDDLEGYEIHCAPLELGSYHSHRRSHSRRISHMDPSLYTEVFQEPFQPSSLFSISKQLFYGNCFRLYGCVGNNPTCIDEGNCKTVITFRAEKASNDVEAIRIQIFSSLPSSLTYGYTAIGLSLDEKMGDDIVIECAVAPSGRSSVYMSWNHENKSNKRIDDLECNPKSQLITDCSMLLDQANKLFKCEFFLRDNFIYKENRFDLVFESYFILHATGSKLNDTNLGKHDEKFASKSKIALNIIKEPPSLMQYVEAHSSIMIVVWIVLVPNAVFVARYFKESWTDRLILGRRIYFTIHVSVTVVGFVALLVAVANILYVTFKKRKRWNEAPEVQAHMKIGGTACMLYLIQIFSGWVRPIDEWSRRIFSIGHWVMGTCALFLALTNLLQSSGIPDAHVPCFFPILVISWLVWTFLCHILMAFHFRWIDTVLGRVSKRGFSPLPMQNVTFNTAPGYRKRLGIWCVYCSGSVLFAGGMIAGIVISTEDCNCSSNFCFS